jgi:hypothetical protein
MNPYLLIIGVLVLVIAYLVGYIIWLKQSKNQVVSKEAKSKKVKFHDGIGGGQFIHLLHLNANICLILNGPGKNPNKLWIQRTNDTVTIIGRNLKFEYLILTLTYAEFKKVTLDQNLAKNKARVWLWKVLAMYQKNGQATLHQDKTEVIGLMCSAIEANFLSKRYEGILY